MYAVNGSDGRCIVADRLIVGVRYLERPLREVLLYVIVHVLTHVQPSLQPHHNAAGG